MNTIQINDKLYTELKEYCDLNNLNISELCNDLLKKGLNELKYGDIPFGIVVKPTVIPIEQELVPVQPMSEPSMTSLIEQLSKSDEEKVESIQESGQSVQIDEKKKESRQVVPNKEKKEEIKTKHKRTRVLN